MEYCKRPRNQIRNWIDDQAVHGSSRSTVRKRRKIESRWVYLGLLALLPQRHRQKGNPRRIAFAYLRDTRIPFLPWLLKWTREPNVLWRSGVYGPILQWRFAVRPRNSLRIQQFWILPARRHP